MHGVWSLFSFSLSLSLCVAAAGHHLHRKQMFFLPFISRERQMDGESEESSATQQGKHAVGGTRLFAAINTNNFVSQFQTALCNTDYYKDAELRGVDTGVVTRTTNNLICSHPAVPFMHRTPQRAEDTEVTARSTKVLSSWASTPSVILINTAVAEGEQQTRHAKKIVLIS